MSKSFKNIQSKQDIFGGAARFLYANSDVAKPTALSDIFNPSTGALASGWNDFGATDGGLAVTRGYDKETWEVDQVLGAIDEFITNWNMAIETSLAEVSLENIQIAWEGTAISTDTGEAPDERTLGIGAPTSVEERMVAFIVDKREVSNVEYVRAYVFWIAKYDGADSEHAYRKGEKTLIPVRFTLLADPTESAGREFGIILDQVVGTS